MAFKYGKVLCVFAIALALGQIGSGAVAPWRKSRLLLRRQALNSVPSSSSFCKYSVRFHTQTLDHSNVTDLRTFQQRYLLYDDEWISTKEGPILVYTGNEGDIVWFCQNTVRKHGMSDVV